MLQVIYQLSRDEMRRDESRRLKQLERELINDYSHSVVPGGLSVRSYSTREMPFTCALISVAIRSTTCAQHMQYSVYSYSL